MSDRDFASSDSDGSDSPLEDVDSDFEDADSNEAMSSEFGKECVDALLFPEKITIKDPQTYPDCMEEDVYLYRCRINVLAEYWAKLPAVMRGPPGNYPGWLIEMDSSRKGVVLEINGHDASNGEWARIVQCSYLAEDRLGSSRNNTKAENAQSILNIRDLSNHLIILDGHLCITGEACCTCGNTRCYLGSNSCLSRRLKRTSGTLYLPVRRGVRVTDNFQDIKSPVRTTRTKLHHQGTYTGDKEHGLFHGMGKYVWANGDVYKGSWERGKMHGKGTLRFASGTVYEGDFVDGKRHGHGTQTDKYGTYVGEWRRDVRHGLGRQRKAKDGTEIIGRWEDGQFRDFSGSTASDDPPQPSKCSEFFVPSSKIDTESSSLSVTVMRTETWTYLYSIMHVGDVIADLCAIQFQLDLLLPSIDNHFLEYRSRIAALREERLFQCQADDISPIRTKASSLKAQVSMLGCPVPSHLSACFQHMLEAIALQAKGSFRKAAARFTRAIDSLIMANKAPELDIEAQKMVALSCVHRVSCLLKGSNQQSLDLREAESELEHCIGFLRSKRIPVHMLQDLKREIVGFTKWCRIKAKGRSNTARQQGRNRFSTVELKNGKHLLEGDAAVNSTECSICLTQWEEVTCPVVVLRCGHPFCRDCLQGWNDRDKSKSEKDEFECIICRPSSSMDSVSNSGHIKRHEPLDSSDDRFCELLHDELLVVSSWIDSHDQQQNPLRRQWPRPPKHVLLNDSYVPPVGALKAIADPTTRGSAPYGPQIVPTEQSCNEMQCEVINGLHLELEGIQGPPGTGKSQTIVNIVLNRLPSDELVLIACMQNKAVDALASKLEHKVPFFVLGSPTNEKLGPVAAQYTLWEQIERDRDVACMRIELRKLKQSYKEKKQRHKDAKDSGKDSGKDAHREKIMRKQYKMQHSRLYARLCVAQKLCRERILFSVRVVLGTVGASQNLYKKWHHIGHYAMPSYRRFQTVILDEAGSVPEYRLPVLIGLNPQKILLVGDHKQLEPYSAIEPPRSLLQRFADVLHTCGQRLPMLTTQYRMHPAVEKYVSENFYGGMLKTERKLKAVRMQATAQSWPGTFAAGIRWVDYVAEDDGAHEVRVGTSTSNSVEVNIVVRALHNILAVIRTSAGNDKRKTVMVITFYQAQVNAIIESVNLDATLREAFQNGVLRVVSVDGAQGSEADFVVLSMVRCNRNGDIGFLHKANRICVSASRAKDLLLIVGHSKTILRSNNSYLKALFQASGGEGQQITAKELSIIRRRWFFLVKHLLEVWRPAPVQVGRTLLMRADMGAFQGAGSVVSSEDEEATLEPEDDFM